MSVDNKSKKALVRMSGMQFGEGLSGEEDTIENIMPGSCRQIGEYFYIRCEEMQEGFTEKTDILLKVRPGYLEMTKKGLVNVNMIIAAGQTHQTNYTTPFGNLLFTLRGKQVAVTADEAGVNVRARYSMDVNYEYLSENDICISAKYLHHNET